MAQHVATIDMEIVPALTFSCSFLQAVKKATKLLPVVMTLGTNVQDAILPICAYSIYQHIQCNYILQLLQNGHLSTKILLSANSQKLEKTAQQRPFRLLHVVAKLFICLSRTIVLSCLVLQTTHRRTPHLRRQKPTPNQRLESPDKVRQKTWVFEVGERRTLK